MFGNTSLASRIRIEDAYSTEPLVIEERNGVAIDRMMGSASSSALFNYQVCTSGEFATCIYLRNFSLAQLGLLGLVLRDLHDGWFAIGFGKSRGLGNVRVKYQGATVQYPGCALGEQDDKIYQLGNPRSPRWEKVMLLGAGEFLGKNNAYQFPYPDQQRTPIAARSVRLGFGLEMEWQGQVEVEDLFIKAVQGWKDTVMPPAKQPQGGKK